MLSRIAFELPYGYAIPRLEVSTSDYQTVLIVVAVSRSALQINKVGLTFDRTVLLRVGNKQHKACVANRKDDNTETFAESGNKFTRPLCTVTVGKEISAKINLLLGKPIYKGVVSIYTPHFAILLQQPFKQKVD
ncbi:unnamed protein product [Clavelina lepadiformis]|uniref:Uncharacterized protein n=1 Tax=Clavelina lepadiformis TaxID=159417 RepID=A0ABP0G3T8_CLALP